MTTKSINSIVPKPVQFVGMSEDGMARYQSSKRKQPTTKGTTMSDLISALGTLTDTRALSALVRSVESRTGLKFSLIEVGIDRATYASKSRTGVTIATFTATYYTTFGAPHWGVGSVCTHDLTTAIFAK